jgi:dTMP kinase
MKGRGAFIVFEGIDRSGKSTQVLKLVQSLLFNNLKAIAKRFPDRTTKTGEVINSYLESKVDLEDHVIHLFFSANRWEAQSEFVSLLETGTSLVVDRYSFSGVAYSSVKEGMDFEWCYAPEKGLLEPDLVIFLDLFPEDAKNRGDYGNERYEKEEFQKKVRGVYEKLKEPYWVTIDASRDIETIQKEIEKIAIDIIKKVANKPIKKIIF